MFPTLIISYLNLANFKTIFFLNESFKYKEIEQIHSEAYETLESQFKMRLFERRIMFFRIMR